MLLFNTESDVRLRATLLIIGAQIAAVFAGEILLFCGTKMIEPGYIDWVFLLVRKLRFVLLELKLWVSPFGWII